MLYIIDHVSPDALGMASQTDSVTTSPPLKILDLCVRRGVQSSARVAIKKNKINPPPLWREGGGGGGGDILGIHASIPVPLTCLSECSTTSAKLYSEHTDGHPQTWLPLLEYHKASWKNSKSPSKNPSYALVNIKQKNVCRSVCVNVL